jgi:hypothetical protein
MPRDVKQVLQLLRNASQQQHYKGWAVEAWVASWTELEVCRGSSTTDD